MAPPRYTSDAFENLEARQRPFGDELGDVVGFVVDLAEGKANR